jgi:hypothetical protein
MAALTGRRHHGCGGSGGIGFWAAAHIARKSRLHWEQDVELTIF